MGLSPKRYHSAVAPPLVEEARTLHYTSVRIRTRTRFIPDKFAPFYAAIEAAFSLSIPSERPKPLTTTHNILLEKSIDVITRRRRVVSTCKFHAVPTHETCKCDTRRKMRHGDLPPLVSSIITVHDSITCFSSNNSTLQIIIIL